MFSEAPLRLSNTLAALPPPPPSSIRAQIRSALTSPNSASQIPILVALDDDPTGTQTCNSINVLTVWDVITLTAEFRATRPGSGFFVLTNSRALHPEPAFALISDICSNLQAASKETGVPFEIVLRGDSTLRGYFPLEADAATSVLGPATAWLLCPFFLQGGRYTINDIHYVADGDTLVPAAQTPFAKDATFGYKNSNLKAYAVEKGKGAISPEDVTSITIDTIRNGGVDAVLAQLNALKPKNGKAPVVVINAAAEEDVDIIVLALLRATSTNASATTPKRFLYRTGAAFVSARLGIDPIPPVTAEQLNLSASKNGGLIIAGSYVPKTTAQLHSLTTKTPEVDLKTIIVDVKRLLSSPEALEAEVASARDQAAAEIASGRDVLVMTSRELIVGSDETSSLDIGSTVAEALVAFLQGFEEGIRPRYVIAKGGITSSDMATKGLRFKKALIVGQASPGVPLWRCDEPTSKWTGVPYVVFPGNVGSEDALYEVTKRWRV
ncbi:hypothetical protein NLU13_7642 [Sarocladium strictum]|uniref:Ketose-bisphosphate aldolase class-II family protein n=1 Tax=Sarocladium strictum TaxID=5046 RepID=A0AA39GEN3_SARSR|nr:hypothetical protein NLU13_7642 [Sarocladium strictum]